MRLLLLSSVIIAVVCQLGDAAYKRGPNSFYGLRRIPRFNRRLIPSRFYPNLYYKPVLFPARHRVYRSAPVKGEAEEMHPEEMHPEEVRPVEGQHHEEDPGHISDIEKRSVGKKLAHLPKWKTDIILNLFGRGSSDHSHFASHFEEFSSDFRGQDRSIEVEELLDEVLTSPSEEVLDELPFEEESLVLDDEDESLNEEDLVVEEQMDSAGEDSEMVEEVLEMEPAAEDVGEEEVEEEEVVTEESDKKEKAHDKSSASRRRRNAVEQNGKDDMMKDAKKIQKRGAISPYLVDEEIEEQEEFTEMNTFGNEGGFLPDNGGFVEEEIVFDEEETYGEGYQPVKRSTYGSGGSDDSFPTSSVHLSPRFNNQPRRKAAKKKQKLKQNTFSSPRNIIESSPSSLPDGYSQ